MAQWSDIWNSSIPRKQKRELLEVIRFTPGSRGKPKTGGKFPHLQPAPKRK